MSAQALDAGVDLSGPYPTIFLLLVLVLTLLGAIAHVAFA